MVPSAPDAHRVANPPLTGISDTDARTIRLRDRTLRRRRLAARSTATEVVLADVRWYLDGRPGRAAYEAGHIPGAVFVDLDAVLADAARRRQPAAATRCPPRSASPPVWRQLGIGDGDTVIAYDDAGGVIAARLVWMLRAIGHDAALLDGGIAGLAGRGPAPGLTAPAAAGELHPGAVARRALRDDRRGREPRDDVLIDARDRGRFAGGPDPVDPRSGHIPGARNVPTREHLDAAAADRGSRAAARDLRRSRDRPRHAR